MGLPATQQKVATVEYSSNQTKVVSLPRGVLYRGIWLNLTSAPTLTGVNNTAANTIAGDDWGVITNLQLVANNTDVLRSFSGEELRQINQLLYSTNPRKNFNLGDASTANPSLESTLQIPITMPFSIKPLDTALDTRRVASLELHITWGSFTNINSAATAWTTEPVMKVFAQYSKDIAGAFSQMRINRIKETGIPVSTEHQIKLNVGQSYRGFLLHAERSTGADDTVDAISNFKLKIADTVFIDLPAKVLNEMNQLMKGNQYQFSSSAYLENARSTQTSNAGWYFLDLAIDGMLSESLDTIGLSTDLVLEVNCTEANADLTILPLMVIPNRGNAVTQ